MTGFDKARMAIGGALIGHAIAGLAGAQHEAGAIVGLIVALAYAISDPAQS